MYTKCKQSISTNNKKGMGKEEKQRYTKCKKTLNMNNQKAFGKIRGTLNAKKNINTYD